MTRKEASHATRNRVAAVVILVLGAGGSSFADIPMNSQQPAAVPAAPGESDFEKKRKADAVAARKAVKARIACCRLHPEVCRQSAEAGPPRWGAR
jgi:hypothetical protein